MTWNDSMPAINQPNSSGTSTGSTIPTDQLWQRTAYSVPRVTENGRQAAETKFDYVDDLSLYEGIYPCCPQAKKQLSRDKLSRHYGAELDIDLDDIQHLMREERHTRSDMRQV